MYNFAHIRDKKTKINSFVKSNREVVLMLRGLSRSYKGWLGLEEDLSEKFDVLCIDFPGVGLSKDENLSYKVDEIADNIVSVINSLEIDSLYILAPSLGSLVMYEIILGLPLSKIKGLAILVPSHTSLGINRISPFAIKTLLTLPISSKEVKIAKLKDMLIGKTVDGRNIFEDDVHLERKWRYQILKDTEDLGRKGQISQLTAATRYTSRDGLKYIRDNQIPLKFFVSAKDKMIPTEHQLAIYEYVKHSRSELIVMENAGHDFVVTHRDLVKNKVIDLISEKKEPFSQEEQNKVAHYDKKKKNHKTGLLFFLSTLLGGILLLLATRNHKK